METPKGRMLFLFVDGVGLGMNEPRHNPFAGASTPCLNALLGGRMTRDLAPFRKRGFVFEKLSASLGTPGVPQSATGQASLLTGRNAASVMQGHYGPYPGPTIKKLLERGTLFSEVVGAGGAACLANAFPPSYHESLKLRGRRMNVPVYAAVRARVKLLGVESYIAGEAVSADLCGEYLHRLDARCEQLTPRAAGRLLAEIASRHDLTFFDYWLSDLAGHRWRFTEAVRLVEKLDGFIGGVIEAAGDVTVLVTSDHGNIEDKRERAHTANEVPMIAVGPAAQAFAGARCLLDVAPAVRRALALRGDKGPHPNPPPQAGEGSWPPPQPAPSGGRG